jgi:hypothetical protein
MAAPDAILSVAGPALTHFQQVPAPFWQVVTLAIGIAETARARKGWVEPTPATWFQLRPEYIPGAPPRRSQLARHASGTHSASVCAGDLGFDPLSLLPLEAAGAKDMKTRELNNGRLGAAACWCKFCALC